MARATSGIIETRSLADGTRAFRLRFFAAGRREIVTLHERPGCECGCGGGWEERAARNELGNVLARIRAGVWEPPRRTAGASGDQAPGVPNFHVYASQWLAQKADGVLGGRPIAKRTQADYQWRLSCYLIPFFGKYRLDEIDRELCLAFKAKVLRDAQELREAIAGGAVIRDSRGRRRVPLSPASIRKLIDGLAAILDDAIEDGHIDHNPARGKRMRVRVPKPARTFLEMDELALLLEAAAAQDGPLPKRKAPAELGPTAALVALHLSKGRRPQQIASELGLAKSTVSFHVQRLQANVGRGYIGRRVLCEILGRSGVRASELCDIRVGHVRLHDRGGARFRIPDSKTETGVREVQMSPDLVEAVIEHLDRLRRMGAPTGPEDYLVPNLRGGRISRQRVGQIVGETARAASEQLLANGLPPLPHTTPHSLRRTYISIALLANNFDVKWVMGQVGHADSKMTLDVYAQLEQRVDRSHGTSFDRLVRRAREQISGELGGGAGEPSEADEGPVTVTEKSPAPDSADFGAGEGPAKAPKKPEIPGRNRMARPGIEPGTPRFSVVCSTN
jgi:integrase